MPLIDAAIKQQNADIAAGKVFNFESTQTAADGLELISKKLEDVSSFLNTHDVTITPISPTAGAK